MQFYDYIFIQVELCKAKLISPNEPDCCFYVELLSSTLGGIIVTQKDMGPVHTGRRAPRNRHTQTMEDIVVNGSVHTAYK